MRYFLYVVAYMALIYYFSSLPQDDLGAILPWNIPDYLLHGVAYSILGLLLYLALTRSVGLAVPKAAKVGWVVAVLYGLIDEYHQGFVPGRERSAVDLLADALGSGITVLALYWGNRRKGGSST